MPRLTHDRQIFLLTLLAAAPAALLAVVCLAGTDLSRALKWVGAILLFGLAFTLANTVRNRVARPLRTVSGLLAALREGDFSIQARGARSGDPLGEVVLELNLLVELLREQRLGALEAGALLRTVMEEINLAVFAFDNRTRLRLVNRAGEKLLVQPAERLVGRTAQELGLAACLDGEAARTFQATFPGGLGRWGMRRSAFRQGGLPHQLLVLADLSHALREEERQAWQRLLRVLGHELNNSLAPIKSIAGSLRQLLGREAPPPDWPQDAREGLDVIAARAEALSRFMESYSRLARLPPPRLEPVEIAPLIQRVADLETRLPPRLEPGPAVVIRADPDQLEQLLINLLRNATDAALETGGGVCIRWSCSPGWLTLAVEDEGPGLSNTANLFVPFFTTKPGGSGIGLVLSRQIAEAHGGSLSLENRGEGHGCTARVRLPRVE